MKNEKITAFAFKTGKLIEEIIAEETNNLLEDNRILQAKILQWYSNKGYDPEFAEHFGLVINKGRVEI